MYIWNKVLIGLICVASLGLFYTASRTLKVHEYWCDSANKHLAKIEWYQQDTQKKMDSIRQVRQNLDRLVRSRGRMWEHCEAKVVSIKKETGEAEVRVNLDPKISFTDKSKFLVYAFEEANVQDKGVYLGEFRLTPDGEKKAKLDPTNRLTPRESDRLASAKKTWVLYDQMPYDSHDAFVHLSDEEKTAMLPAASVAEYVKDGKPSDPNDLQEVVVDGKYVRPLRDYQTLFNADRMNWTEMVDLFAATQRDKNLVEVSLDEAQQQKVASERHVARQEKELAKYTRERDIMAAHHEKVQQKLAAVTTEVAKLMRTNQAMAGQIARFQWDAVRRIDQRVRAMVQLDTKGI